MVEKLRYNKEKKKLEQMGKTSLFFDNKTFEVGYCPKLIELKDGEVLLCELQEEKAKILTRPAND